MIGALQRAGDIEFIQVRHEEMAAFMAVAHAKFTGELGVCLSTGGPGATHLITGLYDGKLDHAAVHEDGRCGFADRAANPVPLFAALTKSQMWTKFQTETLPNFRC